MNETSLLFTSYTSHPTSYTQLRLSHSFISFPSLPHAEARANDRHWHLTKHCLCRLAQAACVLLHLTVDNNYNNNKSTSQLMMS